MGAAPDPVGLGGPGAPGDGGHGQRQRAHAPTDVPDLAGLPRTRSTNGPAGGLLLPGAPNGPNGVQQEPKRSEVLIDLGHTAYIQWANALHHSLIKFDECRLGQVAPQGGKAQLQTPLKLTLGSLPVSASDNPEVRTPTQPAGRTVELRGETLPLQPWARHCMEISDRPTTLPITHDPNLSDKVMYLQMAFKQRPLRDGGGKPSLGRPWSPLQQRWGPRSGAAQGGRHQGRRVKVLRKDWRFQVASLGEEWWVNKVGTYGMASAQSYWGRLAALLLRVLYALFPQVDWNFLRLCG